MKSLSASELLEVWEWGIYQKPLDRTIQLLTIALETNDIDQIRGLTIGERDNYLLFLRRSLFGKQLNCTVECPECHEIMEWESDIDEFCSFDYNKHIHRELSFQHKSLKLKFRLPTSEDIIQSGLETSQSDFSRNLITRCTTKIVKGTKILEKVELPPQILNEIETMMEEADPKANIQLSLSCPNCGHSWHEIFDIISLLWKEIDSWVKRLLQDISVLARNYGWSEKDILMLSPLRRQFYLDAL